MSAQFPAHDYPRWTVDALKEAGIELPDAVPPSASTAQHDDMAE